MQVSTVNSCTHYTFCYQFLENAYFKDQGGVASLLNERKEILGKNRDFELDGRRSLMCIKKSELEI